MGNIIVGRIVNMIDMGTFTYQDGSLGRRVEIWLVPYHFDRYTGQKTFPANIDEMVSISCLNRMADVIKQFNIDSDIIVTYELRGRKVKNMHTGEEKVYNSIEAKFIDLKP